jgi:hypothetical protein
VDRFFHDPEMVRRTEEVWRKVARRYRDHPEVAAYDLLNEPMGAPDNATLYLVQDRLYRAVRAVDTRHLIIIEDGFKGIENMPRPALVGWQNIVLSTHAYQFGAKSEEVQLKALDRLVSAVEALQRDRPVPFYLGEFNVEPSGTPRTMATYIKALEKREWSWSVWTYKCAMRYGGGGMWGWYRSPRPMKALDPFRDSAEGWLEKIKQVRTENLEEDKGLTKAFQSRAR